MKRILLLCFLVLATLPAPTQGQSLKRLERDFRAHLAMLAGEKFAGRAAQSRGDTLAMRYLQDFLRCQKGVQLLFNDGIQTFAEQGWKGPVASFNIAGLIEGSDPALKNEIIVIGAHYDHMGLQANERSGEMEILYGADDNASGTALVMELAQHLAHERKKLKRSVLVVFFGAEEQGLVGSQYFVKHLPVSKERIVCMLNFDMVGRLTAERGLDLMGLDSSAELDHYIRATPAPFAELTQVHYKSLMAGASDHLPFYQAGIPSLCFITGVHADYHRPGDTFDKINYYGMALIYRYAKTILKGLTDGQPITFTQTDH